MVFHPRMLFGTLAVAVGLCAFLAVGSIAIAAVVWVTELHGELIHVFDDWKGEGDNAAGISNTTAPSAALPAYSGVLTCSSVILVISGVAFYGVCYRSRGPLFAFVILVAPMALLELIGLLVLFFEMVYEFSAAEVFKARLGVFTVTLMAAMVVTLAMALLVWSLVGMDSYGSSVYERDMSWCSASRVASALKWTIVVVMLLSVPPAVWNIYFYTVRVVLDAGGQGLAEYVPFSPVIAIAGAAACVTFLAAPIGIRGARLHQFAPLLWFLRIALPAQLIMCVAALVSLNLVGNVRESLPEGNDALRSEIAHISTLAAVTLIISGYQGCFTYVVAVVMITDADSVYEADFL